MTIKLLTEADVLNLPPLPFEVAIAETHSYRAGGDETTGATLDKTHWTALWFNGRLYRVRSNRIWETTKQY